MASDPTQVVFLWHMHQPFYKNLFTGEYLLPWVLLHGTKDYLDMASMLRAFPGMHQNFNFVPSLLIQLKDYEDPGVDDAFVNVLRKPAEELTAEEKEFMLANFFSSNWDNMVRPFPRYYELLQKRGFYYPREGLKRGGGYFSDDDLRDLQVLFFLSWIDPSFYELYEGLGYLRAKGRQFTEEDKGTLQNIQGSIIKAIVPEYRDLAGNGTIELSTSPFYHPIIPLLIDSRAAREALPAMDLPERLFARREDAAHQIESALSYFQETFGFVPKGMWPPEGSVSDAALDLYLEHGVKWLATDEEILFETLGVAPGRSERGMLKDPALLLKPYGFHRNGRRIDLVFRDKELSDLISFHYARSDAKEAAHDCVRRIKAIGESVRGRIQRPLVTIAMDGENAWETYKNDGRDFLSFLYEAILRDESIESTTVSDYLEGSEKDGLLTHVYAGSWIGHSFSIWIGHVEDNTGWDLLAETRDFIEREDPGRTNRDAWESIYIAEGSDWFWWYGDEHSSDHDEVFDALFRDNLTNVYRFLGKEPPGIMDIPIILEDREVKPLREPVNFIRPVIDGEVIRYFDWIGAGYIEGKGHGTAMHETRSVMKGCHYGFDEKQLYLRFDIEKGFIEDLSVVSFEINLMAKEHIAITYRLADGAVESGVPVSAAFAEVLELAIPFEGLGAGSGDRIGIWASLRVNEAECDRIPRRGYFCVKVPSEQFEMEMWYV